MWSAVIPALNLFLLWLIVITIAFLLAREQLLSQILSHLNHPLLLLVLVALFVRLVPMILLPVAAAYDIESFRLVGEALLNGEDVYTSAARGRHPYFPLQMYAIAAATFLSRISPLPFIIWHKLSAVLADAFISILIFNSFRKWGKSETTALSWAMLYALNPVAILVSAYHGQFDAVPVLLLLLAWYSWHFERHHMRSAVFLGFAILDKTWPILFFPVALIRLPDNRRRFTYTALTFSIPILFTAAYLAAFDADPVPMLRRALTHAGVPGYWGLSTLIYLPGTSLFASDQVMQLLLPLQRVLILLAALFGLWWTRHQDALDALLTIILIVFTITFGMGLQWLLWPIAFAVLASEDRWSKWYSVSAAGMMLVHLYGLHLYPWLNQLLAPQIATTVLRLASLPVWIIVVLWTFSRLRRGAAVTSHPA